MQQHIHLTGSFVSIRQTNMNLPVTFRISEIDSFTASAIISGGQTGVDRAALDVALAKNWPTGGWCPRGRRAEDGRLSHEYPLEEADSRNYAVRTRWNVRDADGTLILSRGPLKGGTSLTGAIARELSRPLFIVDFTTEHSQKSVVEWMQSNRIRVLNVAGPRESSCPGIYEQAYSFLEQLLDDLVT